MYQGRWKDEHGKDRRLPGYFSTPLEARRATEKHVAEYNERGRGASGMARPLSFYELNWPAHVMTETARTHQERVRRFRRALGADVPLGVLQRADVQRAQAQLVQDGLDPTYIAQIISSVATLLTLLVKRGDLADNVARDVHLTGAQKSAARKRRRERADDRDDAGRRIFARAGKAHAVSARDYQAVREEVARYWAARLDLLVCSGARPSEWPLLSRNAADAQRQVIVIERSLSRRGVELEGTKNTHHEQEHERGRESLLPAAVLARLDATGIPLDGRWIRAPHGGVLNLNNFRQRVLLPAMSRVAARARDERWETPFVPWTLKDLRHTFATELLADGLPITHVAHWLGDKVTIDDAGRRVRLRSRVTEVYDHPGDSNVARGVAVMTAYIGAAEMRLFEPAAR